MQAIFAICLVFCCSLLIVNNNASAFTRGPGTDAKSIAEPKSIAQADEDVYPEILRMELLESYGWDELFHPTAKKIPSAAELEQLLNDPNYGYEIEIRVNKSIRSDFSPFGQTLQLIVLNEQLSFHQKALEQLPIVSNFWDVSTGAETPAATKRKDASGKSIISSRHTPAGYYHVEQVFKANEYYSKTWKTSLPWAMFFDRQGGYAIHGTTKVEMLGQRDSGGCVRLSIENAKLLNEIIRSVGKGFVLKLDRLTGQPVYVNGQPEVIETYKAKVVIYEDESLQLSSVEL